MDVIDAGGADVSKSSNYLLSDSVGEPVVGYGASTNYILNSGYRQPSAADYLSLSCSSLVTIGAVAATGQKTGSGTCTVYTDAYNGYNLTWGVQSGSGGVNTGSLISEFNDTIAPFDLSGSGLIGYWKMDELSAGSTVKDFTVYGNNGTPNGAGGANNLPQPDTSVPYNMNAADIRSLDFDGTDDYVDAGNGSSLQITSSEMTMSAWVKVDAWPLTGSYPAILSKVSGVSPYGGYQMNLAGDTGNQFDCAMAINSTWRVRRSTSTYATGTWYHVACVYDGSALTIYVNGTADGSDPYTGAIRNVSANLLFGKNGGASSFLNGKIDEARVYNRALSPAEIQALYRTPHTWSVPTTENAWGSRLSSRSTDTDVKWGTDGASEKWLNIGDGNYSIVTRGSATTQSGSTQVLQFRAEVGSAVVQTAGSYRASVTFTVVSY